jgi:hypothetical protein
LLARAHDRIGLPFQVLLERLTGALDAPALYAFVTLDVPRHLDRPRTVDDLAARVGVPVSVVPVLRGARDLREAEEYARHVLEPEPAVVDAPETLDRFRELVEGGLDPRSIVRELKAVGANLKAVRLALTGRERGPELAAVIAALPREELLRRVSA